jgi:formyltetrahydrofolate deformylase
MGAPLTPSDDARHSHRVLVDCPDRPGLIHAITGVLLDRGLNIEGSQEYVDVEARHFFFRAEVSGERSLDAAGLEEALTRRLPPLARVGGAAARRVPLVVLVTREPHCLGELLLLESCGELPGRIDAVVGNHDTLRGLAERFGKPFHHVPHDGLTREAHEARLAEVLAEHEAAQLVLARWMRVLSPSFLQGFHRPLVNIHHSFLPAFAGAQPYRQAFDRGVKVIGATAHFVTAELDEGPIIAQGVIPVDHTFTAQRMAQAGRDVEKLVLARAVTLVLEDRVILHGRRTVVFA